MKWLRAYLIMMPRLKAEEALSLYNVLAVASPNIDKRARERMLRAWQRQVYPESDKTELPIAARALQLAFMGIRLEMVDSEGNPIT